MNLKISNFLAFTRKSHKGILSPLPTGGARCNQLREYAKKNARLNDAHAVTGYLLESVHVLEDEVHELRIMNKKLQAAVEALIDKFNEPRAKKAEKRSVS